ncbi:GNAT family N-acetyltransferase [Parapedobacter pyrenivorans]|uniref:GNAT family N-acetyltransferase n=1 Tax=Parapedobacter pyrenivorans TaxID=1305674 RepID=UPI00333FE7F0
MTASKIKLQPFTVDDFDRLIGWIKDEELLIQFAGSIFSFPLTRDQLNQYLSDADRSIFKVVNEHEEVIGHCEAYDTKNGEVRLCRVLIGEEKFRGKGLGEIIIKTLANYAFTAMNASMVSLNVFDWNVGAIRCYEKAGFRKVRNEQSETVYNDLIWTAIKMKCYPTSLPFSKS